MKCGMTEIRVEVTADDIAYGARCDSAHCPVARALNRIGYGPWHATAHCLFPRQQYQISTTTAVADFITRFDTRQAVEPFTFTIWMPLRFEP